MRKQYSVFSIQYLVSWLKKDRGQSLVEVLIAMVVVALVLTSVVVGVLLAIRSAQFAKHKSTAAFLAQEGLEWMRSQRQELGWGDFSGYVTTNGVQYCLVNLDLTRPRECSESERIQGVYNRWATLTLDGLGQEVAVAVEVVWFEGKKQFSSPVSATLTQWDYQN